MEVEKIEEGCGSRKNFFQVRVAVSIAKPLVKGVWVREELDDERIECKNERFGDFCYVW